MNIAMQKEILFLREQVKKLEEEFNGKLKSTREEESSKLLNAAEEHLINFLTDEGFELDRSQEKRGQLVASLDSIWVSLGRKPLVLSVHMVNGENYSISLESTLDKLGSHSENKIKISQEKEIITLKNRIEDIQNRLDKINEQQFRFKLSTEEYGINGMSFKNQKFEDFQDIMDIMFS